MADDVITYPTPCWYVVGPSPKTPDITGQLTGFVYESCIDCGMQNEQLCGG
jgi:hypothetical protein